MDSGSLCTGGSSSIRGRYLFRAFDLCCDLSQILDKLLDLEEITLLLSVTLNLVLCFLNVVWGLDGLVGHDQV